MKLFDDAGALFDKSVNGAIGRDDMDRIASWPDEHASVLFACADQVRRHFRGNEVDPCTLMNIKSGGCAEDCAFCAQSAHNNTSVEVRGLASAQEIVDSCERARKMNLPFCVVSSGRKLARSEVAHVAAALKPCAAEKHASLGILDDEAFGLLRDAGVSCYNHNLETSRSFFPKIVTTHTYEQRVDTVRRAKRAGLRVCCGGIFGMGESWDDRKDFCAELRELDVDTVPINFLNAIPGTRVAKPREQPLEFLKIVALFRLTLPSKTIKVCGGREANLGALQSLIFFAGADGYVSGGYLTTPGAGHDADEAMIRGLGLHKRLDSGT